MQQAAKRKLMKVCKVPKDVGNVDCYAYPVSKKFV